MAVDLHIRNQIRKHIGSGLIVVSLKMTVGNLFSFKAISEQEKNVQK